MTGLSTCSPQSLAWCSIAAALLCGACSDTADSLPAGPKLAALRKVVAKYKQSPGDFASDKERYRYNDELKAVQEAFTQIPLEVSKNRKEAEAIVRLWQSELEGRYSGELPRVLQIEVEDIYTRILDSD